MEALQQLHRKQQRDLQSQITQKKKSASKKTRKSVNDECTRLEEELKERQQKEIAELEQNGDGSATALTGGVEKPEDGGKDNETINDDDLLAAIAGSSSTSTSTPQTSLSAQTSSLTLNSNDPPEIDTSSSTATRKPNRQKARLARRAQEQETLAAQAASEAANLPDLKEQERARMLEEFRKRGLREKEVAANGHCLYSAVADQMRQLGLGFRIRPDADGGEVNGAGQNSKQEGADEKADEVRRDDYKSVRHAAAQYISSHEDDFAPFLEEPLDEYVHKIRDTGEWGGQLELMALARTYGIDINVLQGEGRVEKIEAGQDEGEKKVAWLAYYRHGFGLGEHYNSLRKT